MIFLEPPKDFNPKFQVVSCFLECDGKFLLLFRSDEATHPRSWGLPAGAVKGKESLESAMARELLEETDTAVLPNEFIYLGKIYVRHPHHDIPFYTYRADLTKRPNIKLNIREHIDYAWVTPREALQMDLILDGEEVLKIYYDLDSRLHGNDVDYHAASD